MLLCQVKSDRAKSGPVRFFPWWVARSVVQLVAWSVMYHPISQSSQANKSGNQVSVFRRYANSVGPVSSVSQEDSQYSQ